MKSERRKIERKEAFAVQFKRFKSSYNSLFKVIAENRDRIWLDKFKSYQVLELEYSWGCKCSLEKESSIRENSQNKEVIEEFSSLIINNDNLIFLVL